MVDVVVGFRSGCEATGVMTVYILVCAFLFSFTLGGKTEKVRCYCNLPSCETANYTCEFEDEGCFSDFLDYRDTSQARHGCLHLLERERKEQCGNSPGSTGAPRSLLLCCKADMCNNLLSPNLNLSHSIIGSLINATGRQLTALGSDSSFNRSSYNPHEMWFKAATIAVPVCGAMILLMLVALAFKILRADNARVEKYRKDANCNANSHIVSFKTNELNQKDLTKIVPLLYETRHEEFRTRIHYGQNVNRLKEDCQRVEKNLENAKLNSERPRVDELAEEEGVVEAMPSVPLDVRVEPHGAQDALEARPVPTLSLNLEKNDWLNVCNIYGSSACGAAGSATDPPDGVAVPDKLYEKYLL